MTMSWTRLFFAVFEREREREKRKRFHAETKKGIVGFIKIIPGKERKGISPNDPKDLSV